MAVLVTGGAGYIGSHTVIELLEEEQEVVIFDNLSNSSIGVIDKIEKITNKKVIFHQGDLLKPETLEDVFKEYSISSVIHFAALKAVGESIEKPLDYYMVNVTGTINLCKVMEKHNVYKLIFSSSATVYGIPKKLPLKEDSKLEAINPYGRTKLMCEKILIDMAQSNIQWKIVMLRYFNPVGAHESGLIGEEPKGIPNNLMPYITKVITGELDYLSIFGNDYPTPDGTGVRDYIHVTDLAKGHVSALNYVEKIELIDVFNLGTGKGHSVFEVIQAFENASKKKVTYKIKKRRIGDAAVSYADPTKANRLLKWKTKKDLNQICKDTWHYINKSNFDEVLRL